MGMLGSGITSPQIGGYLIRACPLSAPASLLMPGLLPARRTPCWSMWQGRGWAVDEYPMSGCPLQGTASQQSILIPVPAVHTTGMWLGAGRTLCLVSAPCKEKLLSKASSAGAQPLPCQLDQQGALLLVHMAGKRRGSRFSGSQPS